MDWDLSCCAFPHQNCAAPSVSILCFRHLPVLLRLHSLAIMSHHLYIHTDTSSVICTPSVFSVLQHGCVC
jgi:hypothetical protein